MPEAFQPFPEIAALGRDRLLKCLCQTEEEKAIAWHSDVRNLERQGIPREFTTKSRVVIISNDWKTRGRRGRRVRRPLPEPARTRPAFHRY